MAQQNEHMQSNPYPTDDEDLERLLIEGVTLSQTTPTPVAVNRPSSTGESDDEEAPAQSDLQGALGLYAEAAQDMATAGVELSLGRHFACADYCNQAVEKAAQSVSMLRQGRRVAYNHDLQVLAVNVGAPPAIQDDMGMLTPFHPEAFYAETPPEEADEVISAEQASNYVQCARRVLRWARDIVLKTY